MPIWKVSTKHNQNLRPRSCRLADKGAQDWIQLNSFLLFRDIAGVNALPFITATPTEVDYTLSPMRYETKQAFLEPRDACLESV
jgi:hypothetical protein